MARFDRRFGGNRRSSDGLALNQKKPHARIFSPTILGPEMAASILYAPGIFSLFLQKARKIPRFMRGGYFGCLGGRGGRKCQFYFYGRGDFSD